MSPIIGSFASGSAFGAKGGKPPLTGLYEFTDAQFVASRYGRSGPSLGEARGVITSPSGGNTDWKNDPNFFNTSNGVQYWTVPYDGNYRFEVWGAKGRNGANGSGQWGARMRGDFTLSSGEIIRFIIGQWPEHTGVYGPPSPYGGGGGGGTFVVKSPYNSLSSIILIAGGGAGSAHGGYSGTAGQSSVGPAGTAGSGGGQSNQHGGAGGGGFFGDGPQSRPNSFYGLGGRSWNNGGNGGIGSQAYGNPGNQAPSAVYGEGGFGGGGGVDHQGGGGGGFNGGSHANFYTGSAGGGHSYNNGTNQLNYSGDQTVAQQDRPTSGFSNRGGQLRITFLG